MSLALWCLLFAALMHLITKIPLIMAQNEVEGGYDNNYPREQQSNLSGWGKRALAAHENQMESFPLFAAGVLVATVSGITSSAVSVLALTYAISRLVFLYLYLKDIATLRSIVWVFGFLASLALICSPAWSA